MSSVSDNWPTYVVLAIYVLLTALVTLLAKKKNSDPTDSKSHVARHFLGSKSFGPVLLAFTTFASIFSGYTVVGVPTEAGVNGWSTIKWLGGMFPIVTSMLIMYPRLRRLSIDRKYESPGDFIRDRYGSPFLSILVAFLLCVPQILYIGMNMYSLGTTLENLTGGELHFYWVVAVSTVLILVFEALGGMRSVAYTDAVEGVVMLLIFFTIPIMLTVYYGGFIGQVNNSEDLTIPCKNSFNNDTNGCLNYLYQSADSNEEISEYYLRSPSGLTILNHILFCLNGLSFCLNPHILQRIMAADKDTTVRTTNILLLGVGFFTMIPGILTGITHLSNQWELTAFSSLLAEFDSRGGFAEFISCITLLAAIAGIVSTADSALIGVSNVFSVDIFKHHVWTQMGSTKTVYVGKAVSLVTMLMCLGFACWMYTTDEDYSSIFTIQQAVLWQSVPAYAFGLFTNFSTNAVLTGTSTGVITCIVLISVLHSNEGEHDPLPSVNKAWSTMTAIGFNLLFTLIAHFIFPPKTQDRSAIPGTEDSPKEVATQGTLTLSKIREIMDGMREPVTYWGGLFVYIPFVLSLVSLVHWTDEIDSEVIDVYGREAAKELLYNGRVRNVIAGLPDYILWTILWYIVAAIFGVIAWMQWDVNSTDTQCGDRVSIDLDRITVKANETAGLTTSYGNTGDGDDSDMKE